MFKLHQIFLRMLPMAVARSSFRGVAIRLCTSGFIDDVIFAHNRTNKNDTIHSELSISISFNHSAHTLSLDGMGWDALVTQRISMEAFTLGLSAQPIPSQRSVCV